MKPLHAEALLKSRQWSIILQKCVAITTAVNITPTPLPVNTKVEVKDLMHFASVYFSVQHCVKRCKSATWTHCWNRLLMLDAWMIRGRCAHPLLIL